MGGGSAEANLAIFQGSSVSNKDVLSPVPETTQDFTGEIEGDKGMSRCSLVSKVCPPFLASSEQGHPLAGSFAPKSLPGVPFSNSPGVELSHRGGVPFFEGVAFPVEDSNRNFKDCHFLRESLSSPKELCISGKDSSPKPEPPTLPLEGFQIEGLTSRKMVKVQSVLESLRIRIVRDSGKDLKLEYKRIRFQEEKEDCQKVFKFLKSRCCDASGNKERNWDRRFMSNVWKGRSMEWAVLPACGASRGIVIMWDSNKFKCTEKLLHPEFKEKFSDWWQECMVEGWEGHKFMRKLKFVKSKLKDWNKVAFGDLRERKKLILSDLCRIDLIEQEENLNLDLVLERTLRRRELEDLLLKEEVHWRQKSRVKWIKEGDCNSKFFHRMTNGRRIYQECWDVIKEDLMRVFLEFHTNGIINQSTNATFIAMVLSGRLCKVLHETISGSQGAFVERRHILDAVLIAIEVVDEKRRSGEEGVVFKIDFEKAYDHMDWGFLDHVLERKGFSPKWRSWIRGCLSSSSFAILVNGNAKGWVKASRGLRQGDPLSHFLFTLVTDVLSRLMIRAEETGLTEGFFVGRDRTRVSLLQFADDTIFFFKASLEHFQNLKIILLVFGKVSGLPLGGNLKTIGFWDPVVERISRSINSLKDEKQQRDFIWFGAGEGKKDHLIRWDVVTRPKELGGLGFGKTSLRNIALLGKWLLEVP
ncbi:LINE-1 retrotransposable element ORF2 protein [Vitis vinifera]|uniref:LINE-1 retrotransposable element ORF2 protein n=1 Tax=Vitis vinifera TaxID=29760 RepID=A0A438KAT3_VITVI|nr:LINE-1 retrotransposable element ORF2 protein [Vitis vinifera]